MFYNDYNSIVKNDISFDVKEDAILDSLQVSIKNNTNHKIQLSASFLTNVSKAYNANHNISSNFILKPFVKGDIENAGYNFTEQTPEKLQKPDLLLLTQGWSIYSWEDIFNNPPKIRYNFEKGIDIVLRLNQKNRFHILF